MATDPSKIEAMLQWPTPKNIKDLRGFLGNKGYYRRFLENSGGISRPIKDLLKRGNLKWTERVL